MGLTFFCDDCYVFRILGDEMNFEHAGINYEVQRSGMLKQISIVLNGTLKRSCDERCCCC
jgi:hypothetical protein